VLARLRFLRGTWLDPFGHTDERRAERRVADKYVCAVRRLASSLQPAQLAHAIELAEAPAVVRGYGPVKRPALAALEAKLDRYLSS
jgi:indolepyruvate ferredoxin oxidoreductase